MKYENLNRATEVVNAIMDVKRTIGSLAPERELTVKILIGTYGIVKIDCTSKSEDGELAPLGRDFVSNVKALFEKELKRLEEELAEL